MTLTVSNLNIIVRNKKATIDGRFLKAI
jgi:hypothetical protein